MIELEGDALVLDIGQGSLASLFEHRDPSSVLAIAISHMHADHHVDLVPLRNLLYYGYPEQRQVQLHVPRELRQRYDDFVGERGFLDALPGPELTAGTRRIGPFELTAHPVTHSLHSFAFRVTDPSRPGAPGLVYSGDCGVADDLLPLVAPGDTLICEAFWSTRDPVPAAMHLTAREAAGVAERAGAGRLILTHILEAHDPEAALEAAREVYPGPVELAVPDMRVDIPDQPAPVLP